VNMVFEVTFGEELSITLGAWEVFHLLVTLFVHFQIALFCEALITELTLEGFFAGLE